MMRALHRWPGLLALVLITILALSGAVLSVFPAAERLATVQPEAGQSVADLARRIQLAYPGVEQISRAPSGRITAFWFDGGTPGAAVIDPKSGQGIGSADPNPVQRWLVNLHRSLFLDDTGRMATAVAAAATLMLALTGTGLVLRRVGGVRFWFARLRGPLAGRLHVEIARVAVVGLMLSSLTALWMTASTFDLLPDKSAAVTTQAKVSGKTGIPLMAMKGLVQTPVAAFRQLSFPYAGDETDVYTLKTDRGTGTLDQGTGALLGWSDLTRWERVSETVYMLHTGKGASLLGLMLGVMALGVPVLGVTGGILWWARHRARPKLRNNVAASRADTVLLVGSEGGSTWGFAATLHRALTAAGRSVYMGPLSAFDPARYGKARLVLILTATYGNGDAPATAKGFLNTLSRAQTRPGLAMAVLGFGDRSYSRFCAFAEKIVEDATQKGWDMLMPFDTVDRQSTQDFARWGRALGTALGIPLVLEHKPVLPALHALTLVSRRDYGAAVQAPTAILRFAVPAASIWQRLTGRGLARFQAGDLLGVCPQGSVVPRFYSIASNWHDGFVEIVVRKQTGGLCSGQLFALEPGQTAHAFVRRNPAFHAGRDRAPLILIGAGSGIGPLAGFIRANATHRPLHLFFGMRHPDSDFLYEEDLIAWMAEGRLARLVTALSRGARPHYVQDALRGEATEVVRLVRDGARVMVCGGRDMANGVAEVLTDILAPSGLTPAHLKAQGRYVEDVY